MFKDLMLLLIVLRNCACMLWYAFFTIHVVTKDR